MRCDGNNGSFWVLDGHGGAYAAAFGAPALAEAFASSVDEGRKPLSDKRLAEGFATIDDALRRDSEGDSSKESGSTVVGLLALREPGAGAGAESRYTVQLLNCGDSRGLLVRPPGEAAGKGSPVQVSLPGHIEALGSSGSVVKPGYVHAPQWPVVAETVDHKPCHPTEKARIYAAGGIVSNEEPSRVDGNLAVSRAIGDFEYKSDNSRPAHEQKVPCLPDVYTVTGVRPGSIGILACDGVWDVLSSEFVANFVRDALDKDATADLGELCAEIIRTSLRRNSRDNITVMIVQFVDGSDWASEPDEITNFAGYAAQIAQVHTSSTVVDEETMTQSVKFLKRMGFVPEPRPCSVCQKWVPDMFQCPCKTIYYCSRKCQKKGWKDHRESCTHGSTSPKAAEAKAAGEMGELGRLAVHDTENI